MVPLTNVPSDKQCVYKRASSARTVLLMVSTNDVRVCVRACVFAFCMCVNLSLNSQQHKQIERWIGFKAVT